MLGLSCAGGSSGGVLTAASDQWPVSPAPVSGGSQPVLALVLRYTVRIVTRTTGNEERAGQWANNSRVA